MKRIYTFALAAFGTIAVIASCAKVQETELEPVKDGEGTEKVETSNEYNYVFGIGAESTDTKSEFTAANKYVSWVEGDDFLGAYAVKDANTSYNQKCDVKTAPALSFVLKSHYALEDGDVIYAYYPYNYINTSTTAYQNPNNVHLSIASAQAQDGDDFDSSAMPMVAKYTVTEDLAADTGKSVGTMSFVNLAGILDFKVYSTEDTYLTESVKFITFKANSPICGEFNYNLSGLVYETASTMTISGYEGTTITTSVTNATALTGSKSTAYDVCMSVAPGTYTGVVEVVTDKAVYTYNVTSAKTVGRSQILSLGVDLGTGSRKSIDPTDYDWALVKSTAAVAVGEWIAFVAPSAAFALSTAQNDNNRGEVAITKSGDALTAATDMQMFEVVAGASSGQLAFKAINGDTRGQYIYAASSSKNYLRSKDTVDGNASWTVSVTSAGVATVTAQGTNTHNLLQYNSGNGIFSAYTGSQQGLAIYVMDDPTAVKLNASTTSVNFLATNDDNDDVEVDFAIKNVSTWNVVNTNDTDFTVIDNIASATSGTVTIAPNAVNNTYSPKEATVTVSAAGADDVVINVSQAAKVAAFTPSTATTTIPASISEYYTITVNSNVPWTAEPTTGADYVEDYDVSGNTTSAAAASDGSVTIEFKDNAGAARTIVFTITPNEVGSGLSAQTITFTQSAGTTTPLDNPTGIAISRINYNSFDASWSNDAHASSYNWVLSEEDDYANVAPANTVASGTSSDATLNTNTWNLKKTGISPSLSTSKTYYLYVQAVGTGEYSNSNYARITTGVVPLTSDILDYTSNVSSQSFGYTSAITVNGWYIKASKQAAMQVNTSGSGNASGSHIKSPTYSKNIQYVRITVSSGTPKLNTSATTTSVISHTSSASSVYTFDLTSSSLKDIYIVSSGVCKVTHIEVDY